MRVPVPPEKAYHLINHGPCNLITTGDGVARNVAPINWTMPMLDDPPLVVMAVEPGIFTDELLKRSGEFAVNVMGEAWAKPLLACGRRSGRDGDKFAATGLTPVPCRAVRPPRVGESIAHLECRVVATHFHSGVFPPPSTAAGGQTDSGIVPPPASTPEGSPVSDQAGGGITLYVGRVLHAEAEEDCFDGSHLVPEKARTLHHIGGGTFAVADRAVRVPRETPR